MKSVRLNYTIRRKFKERVLRDTFAEQDAALETRFNAIVDAVLQAVPPGAARSRSLGTYMRIATAEGAMRTFWVTRPEAIEYPIDAVVSNELYAQMVAYEGEVRVLDNQKALLRKKLDTLVTSVTTTKRLVAVWPAAEQYLEGIVDDSVPTLPDHSALVGDITEIMLSAGVEMEEP